MASQRVAAFIGSGLLIVGAVLVGEVLHVTVVRGETPITDLSVLLRAALGLGLVLVGARLDAHPREYLSVPSDRAGEESGEEGGFDGELSPLDDDAFDSIEAREHGAKGERDRR
ncbi:hypothetical protein ACFQKF_10430 [Halalkalicoccus sp. GCM10025322]|uniref:hypothetical protein n=1 Tax=Halalkalicoccus TaxID=332246 RepID=UPI002F9657A1